ncbi:hypothetical protein M9H77_27743 [Catharanthus roseus]|uniref:Uncharacterized protein n=1 Tax=Catharanthus roseus TaxID=4058 RepID=A0ACC0AF13_CATRO|nr:hypothetical protein M9H77_27743 [Catharanthus roseus]
MAIQQEEELIDISGLSSQYLLSAFHAVEYPEVLISFARDMGGGSIGENVQSFIWNNCICGTGGGGGCNGPYLKRFLKKLIAEIESKGDVVLEELYEHYVFYLTSLKDEDVSKGSSRIVKRISFLFPDECSGLSSCTESKKLDISLQCSLNMLEGDTGCSIWPSSLFLSEFILSFPEIFSNKFCFEVGSGVGLVGLCLAHVNASSVILSDGDLSTLANMKLNLELNLLRTRTDMSEKTKYSSRVECICLPWECATEEELQKYVPDIILGADVVYDPSCLPHLVRVLSVLLKSRTSDPIHQNDSGEECKRSSCRSIKSEVTNPGCNNNAAISASKKGPVAYVASVIRNVETFNYFLELMKQGDLIVDDITEKMKPFDFLPYLKSYPRSTIRLFCISFECR